MQDVLSEFLKLLLNLGVDALNNPAIVGPVIVFALSRIKGPFKLIAQGLAGFLVEAAKKMLEDQRDRAIKDAVAAAEQVGDSNPEKLFMATQHAVSRTGLEVTEAAARVEAEVKRMKDYRAVAEADFARVAIRKNERCFEHPHTNCRSSNWTKESAMPESPSLELIVYKLDPARDLARALSRRGRGAPGTHQRRAGGLVLAGGRARDLAN